MADEIEEIPEENTSASELPKKKGPRTKKQIIEELMELRKDYTLFIEKYGRIRTVIGLRPIRMYDYQKKIMKNLQKGNFNIILKARQTGVSTIVAMYLGCFCMFNSERDILVIAIDEKTAKELVLKIKTFINNLPSFIKPVINNPRNKESIEFANGSRIMASTSTGHAGRSFASSFLVIDECAFIEKADELYTAAYPSLSQGGKCIIISTPNSTGNLFHDLWEGAENGDNEFIPTKVYWYEVPGRDERWKRTALSNLRNDINKFNQEFNCSFLTTSNSVVRLEKVYAMLKRNHDRKIEPIENFKTINGNIYEKFHCYEAPVPNKIYLLAGDTAEGLGEDRDASALVIFDVIDNKVIADFESKDLNEKEFARVVEDIGKTFNNALVILELRSTGAQVAQYLIDWKYPNIFWIDRTMSLLVDPYSSIQMPSQYADKEKNLIPGFKTNPQNKIKIIGEMKNAIENDEIIEIYSNRLLEQLKTYVNKSGSTGLPKYGAQGKNNDDIVMCFGIGYFIKKFTGKIIENNNTLTEQILTYFQHTSQDMGDSKLLTQTSAFSPVYKMSKFNKKPNPYEYGTLGDLRQFLD